MQDAAIKWKDNRVAVPGTPNWTPSIGNFPSDADAVISRTMDLLESLDSLTGRLIGRYHIPSSGEIPPANKLSHDPVFSRLTGRIEQLHASLTIASLHIQALNAHLASGE